MTEQWRWVLGYEGLTEVSDHGRCRRWYEPSVGRPKAGALRMLGEPVLTAPTFLGVYYAIGFPTGPRYNYRQQLHVLVLEAFLGRRPKGMYGCHFPDASPANNALSNLRWDTPSANRADGEVCRSGDVTLVQSRLDLLRAVHPHLTARVAEVSPC